MTRQPRFDLRKRNFNFEAFQAGSRASSSQDDVEDRRGRRDGETETLDVDDKGSDNSGSEGSSLGESRERGQQGDEVG